MPSFVGVFTTNRELIIQVWDATLERLTGIRTEAAVGRPLVAIVPEVEVRGLTRYFKNVLEDGFIEVLAPAFHRYLIPCPPQTPSTRFDKMLQRVTIAPLEQDNEIAGLIVAIEDVTSRVDHERDLVERLGQPSSHDEKILEALEVENWRIRQQAIDQVLQRSAPDAITALLASVRENHRNLGLLNSALTVLRHTNVDVQATLIEFLYGQDADLRMQAALALGEQRDNSVTPALLRALKDENANVTYHAIEALGKLRAREAVDALASIAESRHFFLAFPALDALAEIGPSEVASRLIPLLQDPMLQDAAARTLAAIGDESVVEDFVKVLNEVDAPTEMIARNVVLLSDRFDAVDSRGKHIADTLGERIEPTGIQNLIDALAGAEDENLRSLIVILGWVHSPTAARAITRHLGGRALRTENFDALVQHGSTVTELLISQLESEDLEIRSSALEALGRIRDKRATSALLKVLGKDEELTIPLIGALGVIGDPAAVEPLFAFVRSDDVAVRKAAISALKTLGSGEMAERAIMLLDDPHPGAREAAVHMAAHFKHRECLETLLSRCGDEDESVRRAVVEHLPLLDHERAVKALSNALQQEVPSVRAAAAAAMSHVARNNAVSYLIGALADEDPWVRYFAARSLDSHRAAESIPNLVDLAQSDPFHQVRIAAFDAVARMDAASADRLAAIFSRSTDTELQHIASTFLERRNESIR
jgi:HEAT repeat protein